LYAVIEFLLLNVSSEVMTMAISDDVFRSILAMDSYNRGYGAGILLSGTEIGDAVLGDSTNEDASAQAASFYAQAYTWG
jgi:hypothetical protein